MPEVNAEAPFVIREITTRRTYPMFYTGATLDPHSGRIVSEGWAGDPTTALAMTRDWADYTAGHFNRQAFFDSTGYTYDVVTKTEAVAAFLAALDHASKALSALGKVFDQLAVLSAPKVEST